ncbi:FMN-binding protein [Spirilliplanes yamanashiensis]|nr:FMN-binding protein [Spirilliplanes yamanashiensis]MDP9816923.1 uncharacterized protein with FMN-binding domain [Spirilliplanes yamanashiensis]
MSTVGALVLLFSYRTSTQAPSHDVVDASQARPGPAPADDAPTREPRPAGEDDEDEGRDAEDDDEGGDGGGDGGGREESADAGGTFEGALAQTAQGPVQVSITVEGGRITDVGVLTAPSGSGRHEEINSRALPILEEDALAKQSADVDTVSGATATSGGYRESLQAAIDAANL